MTTWLDEIRELAKADMAGAVDSIFIHAVETALQLGADVPLVLDRMLTVAGAEVCARNGSAAGSRIFRDLADRIENGIFDTLAKMAGSCGGPIDLQFQIPQHLRWLDRERHCSSGREPAVHRHATGDQTGGEIRTGLPARSFVPTYSGWWSAPLSWAKRPLPPA